MALEFKGSKDFTLGIELELQLVNADDFALSNSTEEVLSVLAKSDSTGKLMNSVKHELLRSNLEVNTRISHSVEEAQKDLYVKLEKVMKAAAEKGTLLCSAGTHTFSHWQDQQITDDPRYLRILDKLQAIARRFNIFGLHVHVGIPDGEKCIYTLNRMISYLPHLLALSANSPFWQGADTGLMSYRTKVFENLPVAGLPFYFKDWEDYADVVDGYMRTGTVETIRELWWDIRPHNDFGTLEVRICDSPSTIEEAVAIASLIQALVIKFCDEYDQGAPFERPHPFIVRENKWRAARYGLEGRFITDDGKNTVHIRDAIEDLLQSVELRSRQIGSWDYLSKVVDILAMEEGARRQLRQFGSHGDLARVTSELTQALSLEVKNALEGAGKEVEEKAK